MGSLDKGRLKRDNHFETCYADFLEPPLTNNRLKKELAMNCNQMFKCECGAVLEVVAKCGCGDECKPTCCGKPMTALTENTVDAAKEKHVPVIEKIDGGYKVKVGAVAHPMLPEHHIALIELIADGQVLRQNLKPGDAPEAVFLTKAASVAAREYCNLHGLWTASK